MQTKQDLKDKILNQVDEDEYILRNVVNDGATKEEAYSSMSNQKQDEPHGKWSNYSKLEQQLMPIWVTSLLVLIALLLASIMNWSFPKSNVILGMIALMVFVASHVGLESNARKAITELEAQKDKSHD